MSSKKELEKRLSVLEEKLLLAQKHMDLKKVLYEDSHNITKRELDERYKLLNDQLAAQVESEEQLGHHIGELERSVLSWIRSLDFDI